jgi:hypothetical protein
MLTVTLREQNGNVLGRFPPTVPVPPTRSLEATMGTLPFKLLIALAGLAATVAPGASAARPTFVSRLYH